MQIFYTKLEINLYKNKKKGKNICFSEKIVLALCGNYKNYV